MTVTLADVQRRMHVLLAEPRTSIHESRREIHRLQADATDRELLDLMPTQQRGVRWCRDAVRYLRQYPGFDDGYTPGAFALDLIALLSDASSRRESARRAWAMAFALPDGPTCAVTGGRFLAHAIGNLFTEPDLFRQAATLTVCAGRGDATIGFTDGRTATFRGPGFDQRGIHNIREVAIQTLRPIADIFAARA